MQEIGGGRASLQDSSGCKTNNPSAENDQDVNEVMEAIALLRELAEDEEEFLECESLYKWLIDIAREQNSVDEATSDEPEAWHSNPDTHIESFKQNGRLEEWLEDIFVLDLAAKIQDRLFVGGAYEQDDMSASAPCPYCNKPVGDATDQHVLKCKYAHEEAERFDWMMRRGGRVESTKGKLKKAGK
jgi:hypothetical protein